MRQKHPVAVNPTEAPSPLAAPTSPEALWAAYFMFHCNNLIRPPSSTDSL